MSKKEADTAYERDVLGLPPSAELLEKTSNRRRAQRASIETKKNQRKERIETIPPEDRGPYWNDTYVDDNGVRVRRMGRSPTHIERNRLSDDAKNREGLFAPLVPKGGTKEQDPV